MRVLVWNLFHGRADPPAGRPLLREFADALADWEWDVALLQEVPPWWPPLLAGHCGADWRSALTSRNQLLPLRRAIASRAPDRLKSNGGGANAILVRAPWTITAHGRRRLRRCPERRVVQAVRLERRERGATTARARSNGTTGRALVGGFDGTWIGNVHGQLGDWASAAGVAAPLADLRRAAVQLEAWSAITRDAGVGRTGGVGRTSGVGRTGRVGRMGGVGRTNRVGTTDHGGSVGGTDTATPPPLLLGGDFNLPRDVVATGLPDDWTRIASSGPDHVAGRGIIAAAASSRPERGTLSDHTPLVIDVTTIS